MGYDLFTLTCGTVVGFALGLTGGGGSIFAVPLLIYALGVDVRTAVGVSLAAVGATSAFGVITRLRAGEIDFSTGLIFAISGMVATPGGIWVGERLPQAVVLVAFAVLMLIVGVRMWRQSVREDPQDSNESSTFSRSKGEIIRLVLIGIVVGFISGIFGVGGGFIIVPALVMFGGVSIHRAVATSLLVIVLICASGVASYLIGGKELPASLTLIFVAGGCLGMFGGIFLRTRLSGGMMKRVFAIAIVLVAIFVIAKTVYLPTSDASAQANYSAKTQLAHQQKSGNRDESARWMRELPA